MSITPLPHRVPSRSGYFSLMVVKWLLPSSSFSSNWRQVLDQPRPVFHT